MGLWSKGIDRSKTGAVRTEDDKTSPIDEFFASQPDVRSYEITDNKNGVVNVEGSVHLHEGDLTDGELFFKIDRLTGNLYCHCKHIKPSVVPAELGGEIIFVPNEEELWKNRQASTPEEDVLGMGMLTEKPTGLEMRKKLEEALSDYVEYGFDDINLDEIINHLKKEKEIHDTCELEMDIVPSKRGVIVDFYLVVQGNRTKLKLSAIEKTFYIMFILKPKGIVIEDIIPKQFLKEARKIYSQMGDRTQDDSNGIMADDYVFSTKTLRTYFTGIRNALKKVIWNKHVIQKFAIEGFSGKEFKVEKATDEIRKCLNEQFEI